MFMWPTTMELQSLSSQSQSLLPSQSTLIHRQLTQIVCKGSSTWATFGASPSSSPCPIGIFLQQTNDNNNNNNAATTRVDHCISCVILQLASLTRRLPHFGAAFERRQAFWARPKQIRFATDTHTRTHTQL